MMPLVFVVVDYTTMDVMGVIVVMSVYSDTAAIGTIAK